MILRRLFLYLVSAAGLGLLTAGLALLGSTVLLFVFNNPYAQDSRTQLAIFTAMTLVALPVWGIAFWFAHRFAMRDPSERASAIRHLYVYLACLVGAIGAMVALAITTADLLRPVIDTHATELADPSSRRYVLSVTDATGDDVHKALANLPPQASYRRTPAEPAQSVLPVDGH